MRVHYLEIVTPDVDGVCETWAAALGAEFGEADPLLGGARTAPMNGGGRVGVRPPMRDDEAPVVRPYWAVEDIDGALERVRSSGGEIAMGPMEIPGQGRFAIYIQGGNDFGLWQT